MPHQRLTQDGKRRQIIALVGILVLSAVLGVTVQAAEKKKFTGNGKSVRLLSLSILYPGDQPKHEVIQLSRLDTQTSSNPDFNAEVVVTSTLDQVAGQGTHAGYRNARHADGDEAYIKFEGTHTTAVKAGGLWESSSKGTWQFTGGTGKFKAISGSGTYTGKATPKGATYDFVGEASY